jgi:membrane dipeptidase
MKTARQMLDESLVADAHLDLLYDVERKHRNGRSHVILEDYYDSLKAGGVDLVISSIYVDTKDVKRSMHLALSQISALYSELDECSDKLQLALNSKDIYEAKDNGKLAIMMGFEGVEPLEANIALLRSFYELGVRLLGLCWSRSNWAADGSRHSDFEYAGYGLTEEGKQLVHYAQKLGMLIDVSHANEKTFWDVVKLSSNPIIATHSNTRFVSDTPRNLSDKQLEALAKLGGITGINGSSTLVSFSNPSRACIGDLVDHMEHIREKASWQSICIGLDQCDRIMDCAELALKDSTFDVIPTHDKLESLVEEMISRGFSEEEITGVLGKNLMDVIIKVIG